MQPIDLFIGSYLRQEFTRTTLKYLKERTRTPYRSFLIDNGGNEEFRDQVDIYIGSSKNLGVHSLWNLALALASDEEKYFITSDNDIYVPDVDPDWLAQLIKFMDERPDYGAISLHTHVLIGAASFDPKDPEDVKEVNMVGAVMRIMRTEAVRKTPGWNHVIKPGRNHEERTISSELLTAGYKLGRTTRLRAYHPFGKDIPGNSGWGYPAEFPPEKQGHNPELKPYVEQFDNPDSYDPKTWLPK